MLKTIQKVSRTVYRGTQAVRRIEEQELKRRGCLECANSLVAYFDEEYRKPGKITADKHCNCLFDKCPYEELENIKRDFKKEYDKRIEKEYRQGIKRLRENERRDEVEQRISKISIDTRGIICSEITEERFWEI
jgi:hypothetical protein